MCFLWVTTVSHAKTDGDTVLGKGRFASAQGTEGIMCQMMCNRRHLLNTTEQSMRGGDAALCQITLDTYFTFYSATLCWLGVGYVPVSVCL